ncbi:hypothetical protein CTheo_7833 [Ceratobasidium theobromae]|uniref:Uncharacterized protein n=1 Tax=Ceratobasidium theobromae TaxID=1582974 RepID=A0A5N5QBD3_9AGAM|nr:hypothetical protein CTheo_7833 [Ceratobasidium theobromae]
MDELQISASPQKQARSPSPRSATSRRPKPKPESAPRLTKRAPKQIVVTSDVEDFAAEMNAITCDTGDSDPNPSMPAKDRSAPTRSENNQSLKGSKAKDNRDRKDNMPSAHTECNPPRDLEIIRQTLGELSLNELEEPGTSTQGKQPGLSKPTCELDMSSSGASLPHSTQSRPKSRPKPIAKPPRSHPVVAVLEGRVARKPTAKKMKWVDISDDESTRANVLSQSAKVMSPVIFHPHVRRSPSPEYIDLRGI